MKSALLALSALLIGSCSSPSDDAAGSTAGRCLTNDECRLGRACIAGRCETPHGRDPSICEDREAPEVVTSVTTVADGCPSCAFIAVDATSVYWVDPGEGAVYRAPKGGGGAPSALATGQSSPDAIAVDETNVYWANRGTANETTANMDASIMSVPKAGGVPSMLASSQLIISALVTDATSVYWTNGVLDGGVYRVAKAGGAITSIADARPTPPRALAVKGAFAYWSENGSDGSTLFRAPIEGGGAAELVATAEHLIRSTAVSETFVYWSDSFRIHRAPLGGGASAVVAEDQLYAQSLTFDGGTVYWVNAATPTTLGFREDYVPKSTDSTCATVSAVIAMNERDLLPVPLASSQPVMTLTIDTDHVYWLNRDPAQIARVPRHSRR